MMSIKFMEILERTALSTDENGLKKENSDIDDESDNDDDDGDGDVTTNIEDKIN